MDYIISMINEYGNFASVLALSITLFILLINMIKRLKKRLEDSKNSQERFRLLTREMIKELANKGTSQVKRQEINMYISVELNRLKTHNTRSLVKFGNFSIIFFVMIYSILISELISQSIFFYYILFSMIFFVGSLFSLYNLNKRLYEIELIIEDDYKTYLLSLIEKY